ncbi:hypothetical protein BC828DRAFT_373992 [Blastocladiella britannica]|nr:hypothetical protein BC828DRAFT_373992 [Blastocladiella britannica]
MGNAPSYEPPPMSDLSSPMAIIDGKYVSMTPSTLFLRHLSNSTIEVVLSDQKDAPADWTVVPTRSSVRRVIKSQALFHASTGAAMCTFKRGTSSKYIEHLVFRGDAESAKVRDDTLALRLAEINSSVKFTFRGSTAEHDMLYVLAHEYFEGIYVFVGDPKDGGALVAKAHNIEKPYHCNYKVEVSAGVDRAALVCMLLIAHQRRQDSGDS